MQRRAISSCVFAAAILSAVAASADEPERTIQVRGEGRSAAPPDMATVQTGVMTEASDAADALDDNNEAMRRILGVLREQGIEPRDVQTVGFDVSPIYEAEVRRRTKGEIVGYRVTNQVRVRVRELENLGGVLDALVRAGSNRVTGIAFGLDDSTEVQNQARRRAIEDARQRAGAYAEAAGVEAGQVVRISEEPVGFPTPPMMPRLAAEATAVPIEPGELEMHVTATVVFALEVPEQSPPVE